MGLSRRLCYHLHSYTFSMMSRVKYAIDENVEQDRANDGGLGHTFVHRERST